MLFGAVVVLSAYLAYDIVWNGGCMYKVQLMQWHTVHRAVMMLPLLLCTSLLVRFAADSGCRWFM